jgi:broad specificity polyphosphatase/5'/3'-nucleotidase SurE
MYWGTQFMSKMTERKKLSTEFVKKFIGSFDIEGKGCNEAAITERLEETIEAVVQAGIDYELSYGRNDFTSINLPNISLHKSTKLEYAKIQDGLQIDGNLCQTSMEYQQELQEVARKITLLFADGMDIREISEYIQSLFDLDAQEHFAHSSK